MPAKFKVGDIARVGGKGRPMPACYPWLKRGQLMRVIKVCRTISDRNYLLDLRRNRSGVHHLMYEFSSRRGQPKVLLASFDLRRPEERDRAPGAGRKVKDA